MTGIPAGCLLRRGLVFPPSGQAVLWIRQPAPLRSAAHLLEDLLIGEAEIAKKY